MRPLCAEIDLAALQANFDLLSQKLIDARLIGVVKADGYGHGLVQVGRALEKKASKLAVACFDEAMCLVDSGVVVPILVLEGFFHEGELAEGLGCELLEWVVHEPSQIDMLRRRRVSAPCKVWLKVNTGMNRLGFSMEESQVRLKELNEFAHVEVVGVMTHFACADEPESESYQLQWGLVKKLRNELPANIVLSAANSAAILLNPQSHYDYSRSGIALYGGSPQAEKQGVDYGLKPVMRLASKIIACRDLAPGQRVGYGATWSATQTTRMGVVAVGYGDGYPRQIVNGAPVMVGGRETKVIGRVSMDMVTVDLTGFSDAGVGTEVELWGPNLSPDRVARYADTISYHLLTGVSSRVPRRYLL